MSLPKLTERQVPYTGPYFGPGNVGKQPVSEGKTAEALKRAMSRLGYMPWVDFTQHYGPVLTEAMKEWQKKSGISPATGQYGTQSWDAIKKATVVRDGKVEYALDRYARKLIQDEAAVTSESDDEALVQKFIVEWWTIAIAHAPLWTYDEFHRPGHFPAPPEKGGKCDCSLAVIYAHRYAKEKTGFDVPDPARQRWSGYGNTDEFEEDWPKIVAPYRVGDLAHFGSPRHVIECIKSGGVATAHWGSNGREAAPELISSLTSYHRYPSEFMFVVRPTLIA